ncbi:Uncharacterised protein [Serratia rubidaea]|uniref:Uncharacterized protein n=1 Tax=Serratia rubidaea TaxID=61652 RepID=A0A4U9H929_SERRU|nr:Uncharacterised protein [Serratia rubidaea]
MPYLILVLGLALLLVNYYRLKKLSGSISVAHETANARPSLLQRHLKPLWREWQRYALGNGTWRGRKGAVTASIVVALLLLLNANWLGFSLAFFFTGRLAERVLRADQHRPRAAPPLF